MKKVILLAALTLVGCSGQSTKSNVELVQDMMDQPSVKAQEFDAASPNNSGMRMPPENTVPQGFTPYKWGMDVEKAKAENRNPMAGQETDEILFTGQKYYETHCMVCHGQNGEGGIAETNNVAAKMPLKPPTLLSDKVRSMNDAHLYHIITKGQGVMGPYESHIPQQFRWQVVNYIRLLHKKATK